MVIILGDPQFSKDGITAINKVIIILGDPQFPKK
jgi:hypothetical protein